MITAETSKNHRAPCPSSPYGDEVSSELSDKQLLAAIYDPFDPDRSDLEWYATLLDELGARSVVDLGCGTGTFAVMLAERGLSVIGVDPDEASLEVARSKGGADDVAWLHGDISILPHETVVDAVTMTANVAQVFLTSEELQATLDRAFAALRPGGHIVFETMDPAKRCWERWLRDRTRSTAEVAGVGRVEGWVETTKVDGPLVTFGGEYTFHSLGYVMTPPDTTIRFWTPDEIEGSLQEAGFSLQDVRDAPDRPGQELVFVAQRVSH